MKSDYAKIPSVNSLLENLQYLLDKIDFIYLKAIVNDIISEIKTDQKKHNISNLSRDQIQQLIINKVEERVNQLLEPPLRPVINATGIILHTGLGRAPLGESELKALQSLSYYSNLEINIETGKRGERLNHVIPLLQILTGAEDAVVVNNNAAAVLLCLNTLGKRKEVIVSRGELVEIGGSFRIPEVMRISGAKMVEIGTTNKTHLTDYEQAINDRTAAVMIVHPSNYKITGFTEKPGLNDIINISHKKDIPIIYDLGSGALINMKEFGFEYEPVVADVIKAGADLVSFSGDKLLGGPQAGIIVGKKTYMTKLKKNHLLRALRCDKLTLALLSSNLKKYLHSSTVKDNNMTLWFFNRSTKEMKNIANEILKNLDAEKIEIVETEGKIGSGAYPDFPVKSIALKITNSNLSAEKIAKHMRQQESPIFGYIENNDFMLNLLTIQDRDIPFIVKALKSIL